jgi:superfamily II DNA or RNA helicase
MDKYQLIHRYNIYIHERVKDLINSGKTFDDFDYKFDLHKIFEYFSCIKLTLDYNTPFYEYNDIDPTFKEEKYMNRNDTGIDACNLIDTIVQCKLRTHSLTWKECGTFFGSVVYMDETGNLNTRWKKLIITRNQESTLSDNMSEKLRFKQFTDKTYPRTELLSYCKYLIDNPPEEFNNEAIIEKRDYQDECIKMINDMDNMNLIICLPTGTGKNFIITHSLQSKMKYLILVPRIILMEQIKDEIIKYHPRMKSKIQLIGDSHNQFNLEKDITICVFNSVCIVKEHIKTFNKIFVDEAHHIRKPEIYKDEDEYDCSDSEYEDDDNDEYFDDYYDSEYEDDDEPITELKAEDDTENENCDNKTFIQTIKEFSQLNNNIYLSATIDEHNGFKFYKKDIREMIEKGYLCDYTINIPIFAEDPTNISVCKYLVKNYRNIIIYCNSQKDGKAINKLMNTIMNNCSDYIDCNTSRKKRNDIISRYKSGKLAFLVNVKILVEGFDAPITKGVCFMSLPSSGTTLIQIIGRALRLHPEKTIANVILPFSKIDDEKTIANFMKVMAMNDTKIKKSYSNKKLGGYFDIINIIDDIDYENDIYENDFMKDVELKYEVIFDSMGLPKNNEEIWFKKLELVKNYININKKRPSVVDKDKNIKQSGIWVCNQKKIYKNRKEIMKDDMIYNAWSNFINDEKYKEYFIYNNIVWYNTLELVKSYIDMNKKRPSQKNKEPTIKKLGAWISTQQTNYKSKDYIMKDDMIYNDWVNFINDEKYKEYFIDNNIVWYNTLKLVKSYIDMNKKRPLKDDKDQKIKQLGSWISTQQTNYKIKKQIMKNTMIYNTWTNFINDNKYKEYFIDNNTLWFNSLELVKSYIDMNKKRPLKDNKDQKIKQLGAWIIHQQTNYKIKKQIMKDDMIYKAWTDFINNDIYKEYFLDNKTIWLKQLEEVKSYIDINKNRPSTHDEYQNVKKLGIWISNQQNNYEKKYYIMKNTMIYNDWTNFINDNKYKEYFKTNKL